MVGAYNKQHGQIKDLMHPQSKSRFSKGIQESDSVWFFDAENWNIGPFQKKAKAMLEPLFFNISESQLSGHVVDCSFWILLGRSILMSGMACHLFVQTSQQLVNNLSALWLPTKLPGERKGRNSNFGTRINLL